jgi:hypothetical protein
MKQKKPRAIKAPYQAFEERSSQIGEDSDSKTYDPEAEQTSEKN